MAMDTTTPRSRRALLTAAAGAVAATAVQAVAKPLPAHATTDHVSYINNETAAGVISGSSVHQSGFPDSGAGIGVFGWSDSSVGVYGTSTSGNGVEGTSASGAAIKGTSSSGTAIRGASNSGTGVDCTSGSGFALYSSTNSGTAVFGTSTSGYTLEGVGYSDLLPAVLGYSYGGNGGVQGYSGTNAPPASPAKTGVFGAADQDAAAVGVRGTSPAGRGGLFKGGAAQLKLSPSTATTHPTSGQRGDLFVDKNGRLWFCKGGTTWKQLA